MVLNKKEKVLMNVIYNSAVNRNGQCLISPVEILQKIPYKVDFRETDLDAVLVDLQLENYFEVENAKKKGDLIYCITLKEKGLSYIRDKKTARKKLIIRLITAVGIAALGWIIKLILSAIF